MVKNRITYLRKYLDKVYKDERKQAVYSLILFTLFVENVSLFSQLYTVAWFRSAQNILPDTAQQIEYTRNEEHMHAQAGIWMINTVRAEHPELFDEEFEARITEEINEALTSEDNIIDWIMGGFVGRFEDGSGPKNLDADLLKEFIRHRLSESMKQIGFDYDYVSPREPEFRWFIVELKAINTKDFFTGKVKDYGKNNKSYAHSAVFG